MVYIVALPTRKLQQQQSDIEKGHATAWQSAQWVLNP